MEDFSLLSPANLKLQGWDIIGTSDPLAMSTGPVCSISLASASTRNNGDGSFEPGQAVINDMCYSAGWRIEKHLRFVSDLTGNGRVDLDLIGFSDRGMFIALNNGNGTFQEPKLVLKNNAGGWRVEKNPRFIADLTGNKAGDIVGFGNNGVYVAINNGDGTFQPANDDLTYDAGDWRVEKHLRVSFNNGKGSFGPVQKLLSEFAYNGGERSLESSLRQESVTKPK